MNDLASYKVPRPAMWGMALLALVCGLLLTSAFYGFASMMGQRLFLVLSGMASYIVLVGEWLLGRRLVKASQ